MSAIDELREEYHAQLFAQARDGKLRLPPAPWLHKALQGRKVAPGVTDDFSYLEGYSYTEGRLNMPLLGQRAPFNAPPFREHPDLTWLCNEFYGSSSCAQTTQGALWNFPGANTTHWHRDFPVHDWQLLTVITAAADYPQDAGWLMLQRGTHLGGPWENVSDYDPPSPSRGEPAPFQAVLRKGDTLIFTASTKHAATPNPTGVARGLLFSLYAVDGREELPTRKHRPQT